MELPAELEIAKNEVQRKIGRNLLNFQQVEHLLKFMLANGNFGGYASELVNIKEKRKKAFQKQTLGNLVGQYLENTYPINGLEITESTESTETLKESRITFSFQMPVDSDYFDKKKKELAKLVDERNDLIHHLLPRIDLESIDSWREAERYLDQQREKILPELTELQEMAKILRKGMVELAEYIISDEGEKYFKLGWLQQTPLALLLCDIATQAARPDGWISLCTAGKLIKTQAPEERALLREKYGYKTLREFLLATELFEFAEESTKGGGKQVLCRLKKIENLQLVT